MYPYLKKNIFRSFFFSKKLKLLENFNFCWFMIIFKFEDEVKIIWQICWYFIKKKQKKKTKLRVAHSIICLLCSRGRMNMLWIENKYEPEMDCLIVSFKLFELKFTVPIYKKYLKVSEKSEY